jgi:hypothetical protein
MSEQLESELLARRYRAQELADHRARVIALPRPLRWAGWMIYWIWREATRMYWE